VKGTVLVGVGLVAVACSAAHAQNVPAPAEPAPAQGRTSRPTPATVDPRRDDIRVMETVLTQALQKGAQDLARQLKVNEPNSAFVTGTGRARGFVLDSYGVFFDVDVPGMKQSVVWSTQMLELAQQRASYLQFLANSSPDDPRRPLIGAELRRIDRLMAAPPGAIPMPAPTQNAQLTRPDSRMAEAQTVADGAPAAVPPLAAAAPPGGAQATEFRDPNELYTDAVKSALIDAMLRYGPILKIADAEWLTIAASDSDGPQRPGQLDDATRIVIRVKGSDLAALQSGKLTRDDVLKRVEVREF
jgi:hypothetical protein